MANPLVSIILCTYNGERFLKEQLDSIINQTYANIEIIISDDCSTDNTKKILYEYVHLSNIHLYLKEINEGYIKNFQVAASLCNGTFIAFSDQDDIWMPNKIEILLNNIDNHLLVYSDSLLVNEIGEPLNKKLSDISEMYSGKCTRGFILWNVVWGHTMLIKKELLEYCLPIPKDIPHDIWMAFKATTLSGIKYVDEVLTHYRQHDYTVTRTTYGQAKVAKRRDCKERYEEFEKKLSWFKIMRDNERDEEKLFYSNLVKFYAEKEKGFSWNLFFFMLKYHKDLFMFRKKKFLSQIIEIRKQSRFDQLPKL